MLGFFFLAANLSCPEAEPWTHRQWEKGLGEPQHFGAKRTRNGCRGLARPVKLQVMSPSFRNPRRKYSKPKNLAPLGFYFLYVYRLQLGVNLDGGHHGRGARRVRMLISTAGAKISRAAAVVRTVRLCNYRPATPQE